MKLSAIFNYLEDVKHQIRLVFDKAAMGGKKKPKKGAAPELKKLTSCVIFVSTMFPEYQKIVTGILKDLEWNEENECTGAYVKAIKEAIPDKKQQGVAMRFCAYKLE